jgi:hypothetical protein
VQFRVRGQGGRGAAAMHGQGHVQGQLACTTATDRVGASHPGEGHHPRPWGASLRGGHRVAKGPRARIKGVGNIATCNEDSPTFSQPRSSREGAHLPCHPSLQTTNQMANPHSFKPQKATIVGSVHASSWQRGRSMHGPATHTRVGRSS